MEAMLTSLGHWAAGNLLQVLLSIAAMFLIPIAKHYAALLKDERLRRIVQAAILEVEETAAKHAGTPIASSRKLDLALQQIAEKVPGITREEAHSLVHQELPKVRAAIGDFTKATLGAALSSSPAS